MSRKIFRGVSWFLNVSQEIIGESGVKFLLAKRIPTIVFNAERFILEQRQNKEGVGEHKEQSPFSLRPSFPPLHAHNSGLQAQLIFHSSNVITVLRSIYHHGIFNTLI